MNKPKPTVKPSLTVQDHEAKAIKLCNIAASQLGWKENGLWEGEQGIKKRFGGKLSLKEMKLYQLNAILAHARACGFKVKHKKADGTTSRPLASSDQAKMIRGLWLELHELGAVKDKAEAALSAWVRRQTGLNALNWASPKQMEKMIEALKAWKARTQAKPEAA